MSEPEQAAGSVLTHQDQKDFTIIVNGRPKLV